jgi:hypothetical protein
MTRIESLVACALTLRVSHPPRILDQQHRVG